MFNGSGGFNDAGKTVARLTIHYVDATSHVENMIVGLHLRSAEAGAVFCPGSTPYYTAQPSSSLMGVLWTGGAPTHFYDINEFQLPTSKRNVRVDLIRVEGVLQDHVTCPFVPHIYSGSRLHGLSVWPKFSIQRGATTVALQTQVDPTWGGDGYGGYVYNDTLIGQHRTIGEFGCVTACLSMANNYYGSSCTPRTLNQYLQGRTDGHFFSPVTLVTAVAGNSVNFTILPGAGTVGPTFLIQRGRNAPVATVAVQSVVGSTGTGTITQRFLGGAVAVGDFGVVYDEVNYLAASAGFSIGVWQVTGLKPKPGDTIPALAESTMAADTPVLLYTGIDTSGATHWVVGEGREPAFVSSAVARGTYRIKDPGYVDGSSQPLRRLLQSPHNNVFQSALVCTLLTTNQTRGAAATTIAGEGLAVRVQGLPGWRSLIRQVRPSPMTHFRTVTFPGSRTRSHCAASGSWHRPMPPYVQAGAT